MSSADGLRIYVVELAHALEQNLPPPPIPPDLPVAAGSEIDLLLAGLGMAANAGDAEDLLADDTGYVEREQETGAAMLKFPANEDAATQALQQVMGMAQQVPEAVSGAGMGIGGVFGGFLQSLSQALQQGAQAGQQLAGGLGDDGQDAGLADEPAAVDPGETFDPGETTFDSGGGFGATAPAGNLDPPAAPPAATFPASSPGPAPALNGPDGPTVGRGAPAGFPVLPAGAVAGSTGTGSDAKADTKRVVAPAVRNGAPVQGRITARPALPAVTKRVDGRPVRALGAGEETSEGR